LLEPGVCDEPITELLKRIGHGDRQAMDDLLPLVYEQLRRLARSQRRRSPSHDQTLDTTALVHEAYLKLARGAGAYEHRGHFFAVAATAMRQVLIDEARHHLRRKRGSGERPLDLDERQLSVTSQAEFLLALDEALGTLAECNPRLRQVVECRFFAGLTEEETAEALAVTSRTVRRDWAKAKAWLTVELWQDRGSPP
jgi:RNA polymerase sigma factor (TIGR02999 family)